MGARRRARRSRGGPAQDRRSLRLRSRRRRSHRVPRVARRRGRSPGVLARFEHRDPSRERDRYISRALGFSSGESSNAPPLQDSKTRTHAAFSEHDQQQHQQQQGEKKKEEERMIRSSSLRRPRWRVGRSLTSRLAERGAPRRDRTHARIRRGPRERERRLARAL